MSPEIFEQCVKVAVPFLSHSDPDEGLWHREGPRRSRRKVLGIFGGEPLMHPKFPELVDIFCQYVPRHQRGLWTSYDWYNGRSNAWGSYRDQVTRLLGNNPTGNVFDGSPEADGYVNWNMHEESQPCEHQPLLAAIDELVSSEYQKWRSIRNCWVPREWSAAYALNADLEPRFYFCEVASSFDRVFRLNTGLPVEEGVWSHHLWFEETPDGVPVPKGPYAQQILSTCGRCGGSLPLKGRRDREFVDYVSPDNLQALREVESPMIAAGQYQVVTSENYMLVSQKHEPWEYLKDGRKQQSSNFQRVREANR